jgi:hypothetical protein
MEYFKILIQLFEPFLNSPPTVPSPKLDVDSLKKLAQGFRARLETLIRIYYIRHSFSFPDPTLCDFILVLGSICIQALPDMEPTVDQCATVLLCAQGLIQSGLNDYLPLLFFSAFFDPISKRHNKILAEVSQLRAQYRLPEVRAEYVNSKWPVYQWINPEEKRLSDLVMTWQKTL